jgi:UDP-N-acetylmuramate dehydrogenase
MTMTDSFVDALAAGVGGTVLADEPLARHTTLRVGGPAAALVRAETPQDLVAVARICAESDRPWLILGRGSNLLVADVGWPGVVVTLGRGFRGVVVEDGADHRRIGAAVRVTAGAAEPMPVLAQSVARRHLGGLAFGVAIPGSLGGAVRMNAGAHGAELSQVLVDAEVLRLDEGGACDRLRADDLRMRYRSTALPAGAVVVRATLRLHRADPETLAAEMAEMRQWRRDNQPINQPSCGSVFRNPHGDSAGRLIESAGMKGHRVGGATVSAVHANFITVATGARADDVRTVIRDVRRAVLATCGVRLETEVVLAGFEAAAEAP